jgi:hypothetical protein
MAAMAISPEEEGEGRRGEEQVARLLAMEWSKGGGIPCGVDGGAWGCRELIPCCCTPSVVLLREVEEKEKREKRRKKKEKGKKEKKKK